MLFCVDIYMCTYLLTKHFKSIVATFFFFGGGGGASLEPGRKWFPFLKNIAPEKRVWGGSEISTQ